MALSFFCLFPQSRSFSSVIDRGTRLVGADAAKAAGTPVPPVLIDIDANLTHHDLIAHHAIIVKRSVELGIIKMIVPGSTVIESKQAIDLCRKYPKVGLSQIAIRC